MNYASVYAAIIAGGALTYSTKVKADPVKVIADAIAEAVKYAFNEITESGYKMLWEEMAKDGENPTIAIGISTDNQNEVSKSVFEHRMKRINMPEPMPCKARTSKYSVGALTNVYSVSHSKLMVNQTKTSLAMRYNDVRFADHAKTLHNRYGDVWTLLVSGYGSMPGKINLVSNEQVQLGYDWIENINGSVHYTYPSILQSLKNYSVTKRTILSDSAANEVAVSTANQIFTNALSKRMAADGVSTLQECTNEINRTYGDRKGKYRAHINSIADPIPAMREALKLKAFNNYLKLLIFQERERELLAKTALLATKLAKRYDDIKHKAATI